MNERFSKMQNWVYHLKPGSWGVNLYRTQLMPGKGILGSVEMRTCAL